MKTRERKCRLCWEFPSILLVVGAILIPLQLAGAQAVERAQVLPREDWTAGSTGTIEVIFRCGPSGVGSGGSIGLAFKHALNIRLSTYESEPGYVKVLRASGAPLSVRIVENPPCGAFQYPRAPNGGRFPGTGVSDLGAVIRYSVFAKVDGPAIAAGEAVRFVLGADNHGMTLPPNVCENPMRVVIDEEGDGSFRISESVPSFRIVAGPVDHLYVTVPSTRIPGERADICIRAEDRLNCVANTCEAEVRLSGLPGLPQEPVKLSGGLARIEVEVRETGVWRITAASGAMAARSNPMVVSERAERRVYWGDLHVHTTCSDALGGDPDYAYTYARDTADLEVCALADHAPREPSREATRKYNEAGRFVTIWGYEWAESTPGRLDRNLYFRSEDDPIPPGWPAGIEDFWKSIESVYGDNQDHRIIVGPHMFTYQTMAQPWYATWDERYERFVEIYSEHGMSEYEGNPRMLAGGKVQPGSFVQEGLAFGRKFGLIASSDTHDSRAGRGSNSLRYQGGLVAFCAPALSRESIWDAFWERRVYAVTNARIYVDFQIDGHSMGESFETLNSPLIRYSVYGCDDDFESVLIKDNQEIRRTATTGGEVHESFRDESLDTESFYYLRVVQKNGEYAWSSPIWVKKAR